MSLENIHADFENIILEVQVSNTGNVSARFVPQVYVTAPLGELNKPYQELKGYAKTSTINPGKGKDVLRL